MGETGEVAMRKATRSPRRPLLRGLPGLVMKRRNYTEGQAGYEAASLLQRQGWRGSYTPGMPLPNALTRSLREAAERDPDVCALYVFGSRVAGTARPDSDLDVGVLYGSRQSLDKTLGLEDRVAEED